MWARRQRERRTDVAVSVATSRNAPRMFRLAGAALRSPAAGSDPSESTDGCCTTDNR